ncbi:3-phosphoshikimate 1-carboxyvinyltransferase [Aminicella lysinilytica]|uniref:3-phosphoshikimate 1-carboxyvinyltransferase n=1 Tax=Aminicella lysinilytica TaxID=433323 RepID=A0A4R6Q7C9_9FIRM|nr:3-phosphoshikimate 1-carboxyvinyltransferase [Aminicella lysinilytica]TDP58418.1 3-phosphoshikimate 1-carboxyvinyltransferase [Aminicella lysinilytica]
MINIDIIPSKSYAHRALICAALSETPTEVVCPLASEDIRATRECVRAMKSGETVMDCGESGSTLRFMLPVIGALGCKGTFVTKGRLAERPMGPLIDQLASHGCAVGKDDLGRLTIEGQLTGGIFHLPGNVSSQFITGLLLALPNLAEDSRVVIEGHLESAAYVDITLDVLKSFGIRIAADENTFLVKGGQKFRGPIIYTVEGDWSAAANWLVAGAIGSEPVRVRGLNIDSRQGDMRIVEVLGSLGCEIGATDSAVTAYPSELSGTEIDVSGIPDLTPAIALAASMAEGQTHIINAGRLRLKESDRLTAISDTLNSLGARVIEEPEGLIIKGSDGVQVDGGTVDSFGDHRIVMMVAVASLVSRNKVEINGREAVNKSYPGFFKELEKWR